MSYPRFHPQNTEQRPLILTEDEFAASFPEESRYVEFKSSISSIVEPVVAFSNASGGVLLVGVGDDGRVRGHTLTGHAEAEIHQKLRDGALNVGRYSIHSVIAGSSDVTVISVARRVEGFAQTRSGRTLIRRGASNTALVGEDLVSFLSERRTSSFESTTSGIDRSNVSEPLLEDLRTSWGWSVDGVDARLNEAGLLLPDRTLSVAGALLLHENPGDAVGKSIIEILRYEDESDRYIGREAIEGPAQHQIDLATHRVVDSVGSDLVILGTRRRETPRLPTEVVREAIANAVAHRSYELARSKIVVRIRPSYVEIVSPGALPEPVTIENIREQTAARNPRLMDCLRRLGLAEDIGRGVDVMQDKMAEALLDPPVFDTDGASVTVILKLSGSMSPEERAWVAEIETRGEVQPGDRSLLVLAARGEVLTNSSVRADLDLDSTEARAALQRLRDAELLVQLGERGGAQYVLSPSIRPTASLVTDPTALTQVVLELAEATERVTNAMVREATGLDRQQTGSLLRALVENGLLEPRGSRRGSHYVISANLPFDFE